MFPKVNMNGCPPGESLYVCRSLEQQAGFQLAGMAVTIAIAVVGGICFGGIASLLTGLSNYYDDSVNFLHVDFDDDMSKFNKVAHEQEKEVELSKVASSN